MFLYVGNKDCRLEHLRVKGLRGRDAIKLALEIGAQCSIEVGAQKRSSYHQHSHKL